LTVPNVTNPREPRKPNRHEHHLRRDLAALKARYDGGAVAPAVYTIIKAIEVDLGWIEHRGRP